MLLIVGKRMKGEKKARMYGDDDAPLPGLPPLVMAIVFLLTLGIVVIMAKLKFVNETLIFSVVACILFFVYMLKLTLFETPRPVLLAAPRHSPLNDHLFD